MPTYYVDTTTGDNADTGLTEALAWATIAYAESQMVAGDKVYVKASATYNEQVTTNVDGGIGTAIVWEGYDTTPGDNGKVTIDGTTYCVSNTADKHSWRNFIFTAASSNGFNGGAASDEIHFYNCEFTNNGGYGVNGDNNYSFYNCVFDSNTSGGVDVDSTARFVGCIFKNNTGSGTSAGVSSAWFYKCLWFNNSATADVIPGSAQLVIGCTMDGESTTGDGIGSAGAALGTVIADNIIHDIGGVGVTGQNATQGFYGYNLFSSVTGSLYSTDYGDSHGIIAGYQDPAEQAPAFTDETGDDYTLDEASPAIGAGITPGGIT